MATCAIPANAVVESLLIERLPLECEGETVQFRLVYRGQLPPARWEEDTRRKEKHLIRKQLHKQLKELWQIHPLLKQWSAPFSDIDRRSIVSGIADNFDTFGFRWVPLITDQYGIACGLDILFLRRDEPGNVIKTGGDIDNRLKVLFDALRLPTEKKEIAGFSPEPDGSENPFFCLLQGDGLINEVRVETDRLLTPLSDDEAINDVELIIHVKTLVVNARKAPTDFYL
jgi:hypothetical protein